MANARQIVVQLENFTALQVKKLVSNITANLLRATPVDTGWARANWVPKIGSRNKGTVGSPSSVSPEDQTAGLLSVQTTYTLEKGKVFISNNVPYISKLNAGSSQQAPDMFIENAVNRAIAETR